jgi:hypothetical protein
MVDGFDPAEDEAFIIEYQMDPIMPGTATDVTDSLEISKI